uniref:Uncharacterized protein n=1 Tax=Setaria viridis TaxID=4556 RepID=A0A4U6W8N2_SETVI|nr:hypothetical protein SEVIR_1G078084v2 [Setaria viridis]
MFYRKLISYGSFQQQLRTSSTSSLVQNTPAAGGRPEPTRRKHSPERHERLPDKWILDTSITWVPRAGGASPWPSCRCRPPRRRGRRGTPAAAAAAAAAPAPARRRRAPSARGRGRRTPATCSRGRRCSWLLAASC